VCLSNKLPSWNVREVALRQLPPRGSPLLEEEREEVSADTSASYTKYGDGIALRRMENAGAIVTTMDQIVSELVIDWISPNGQKLQGILAIH
jgi:hypothetical protein